MSESASEAALLPRVTSVTGIGSASVPGQVPVAALHLAGVAMVTGQAAMVLQAAAVMEAGAVVLVLTGTVVMAGGLAAAGMARQGSGVALDATRHPLEAAAGAW